MSQTFEFYASQAKAAFDAADAATLDNVRDRNLRAAKSWSTLADQALRVRAQRAKTEAEKAERDALAQAAARAEWQV